MSKKKKNGNKKQSLEKILLVTAVVTLLNSIATLIHSLVDWLSG